MKTALMGVALCGLLLAACKPKEAETAASAVQTQVGGLAFEQAANRYLIDTKAVKTECSSLFDAAELKVMQPEDPDRQAICGKMTLGLDTTRQMIDIAHGRNQASPWTGGDEIFTAGVFSIDDNVLMTVYLFPQQGAVMFH